MSTPSIGSKVQIMGLQSKPELNGCIGTVLGPDFSQEAKEGYGKGRIPVKIDDREAPPLLLKPSSLQALPMETSSRHLPRRA